MYGDTPPKGTIAEILPCHYCVSAEVKIRLGGKEDCQTYFDDMGRPWCEDCRERHEE